MPNLWLGLAAWLLCGVLALLLSARWVGSARYLRMPVLGIALGPVALLLVLVEHGMLNDTALTRWLDRYADTHKEATDHA